MNTKDEALRLALEALEYIRNCETDVSSQTKYGQAEEVIKQALEQPEPEPVAWLNDCEEIHFDKEDAFRYSNGFIQPLYTSPPKREWQGLTDEEINEVLGGDIRDEPSGELKFVRAIEAKLKEKNHG